MRLRRTALTLLAGLLVGACSAGSARSQGGVTTTAHSHDMANMSGAMPGMSHDMPMGGMAHHHIDSKVTYDQLPAAARAQVDTVIAWSHTVDTPAKARAAGWAPATRSLYGIGAHWLHGGVVGFTMFPRTPDIHAPDVLLYDGEGPDAKLAGVSWILNTPNDPKGFISPEVHWHRHSAVCYVNGIVVSEGEAEGSPINLPSDVCKARGGFMIPITNLTMMHLWIGDGYMGSHPIFAHDNSLLYDGYLPQKDAMAKG